MVLRPIEPVDPKIVTLRGVTPRSGKLTPAVTLVIFAAASIM